MKTNKTLERVTAAALRAGNSWRARPPYLSDSLECAIGAAAAREVLLIAAEQIDHAWGQKHVIIEALYRDLAPQHVDDRRAIAIEARTEQGTVTPSVAHSAPK